jgi:hypothetical protein
MLKSLRQLVIDRQLRLFAVACCRRVWHLIEGEPDRGALAAAVAYAAEGGEASEEWRAAWQAAWDHDGARGPGRYVAVVNAAASALAASAPEGAWPEVPDARASARLAASNAATAMARLVLGPGRHEGFAQAHADEVAVQADLLRDVVGNPFRRVAVAERWLSWEGGTVVRLAEGIEAEGAYDRLPVLADALEEAGCADAEILGHCRGPMPHVRGCWVVRGLLARE